MARTDLQLRPYKISIHQKLRDCDEKARKRYCARFSRKCNASVQFIENIWFQMRHIFNWTGGSTAKITVSGALSQRKRW